MASSYRHRSYHDRLMWTAACLVFVIGSIHAASASELDAARRQFRTGRYAQCLESSQEAIDNGAYQTEWRRLIIQCLMALGRYDEATAYTDTVLRDSRASVALLRLAHTTYQSNGQADQADGMLAMIYRIATTRRAEYMSPRDIVALGQSLLLLGAEPRFILNNFYDEVVRSDPNCREAYLAAGSLALDKQDYELAAERYRQAIARFGDDPDAHCGLAAAFYHSDRGAMMESLDAALHVNPRHAPARVLLAEHHIDCENHEAATASLDRVLAVNPWYPDAWAYRAVLAHLANEANAVSASRAKALKFRPVNPRVDYLIGRKLSQKYRFTEGAAYQRQALESDPNYLPAKIQLAQDLLRLGDEPRGWALAEEVNAKDAYNIEAYNLAHLRDTLSEFTTLSADDLIVRMEDVEAAVYGDKVIELLKQAGSELSGRYGVELKGPVTVELFPHQQDFAVRTFGMPGGDGFLGVCFGNVITANSPKADRSTNWQATLWHEFCHVVTLNLTANKMPRWLSEGISVYEESRRQATWGQRMTPQYRRMILEGQLTPIGKLSAAFLNPPTPMHLQFAYYESALVVEFLIERFGFESLKAILADLRDGEAINAAISRHAAPLKKVEDEFDAFARRRAEALAPQADWEQPDRGQVDPSDPDAVARWLATHENNVWALQRHAGNLLADKQWEQAKKPLEKLIALYPEDVGEGNAYRLLAEAHRHLGETQREREILKRLATRSADAADAYRRLMEVGTEQQRWQEVVDHGARYLAVYPLLGTAYQQLGRANEELGQSEAAIEAYRCLLLLEPEDPVDVHYRLAKLLQPRDPVAAKHYLLEALADAPRFRRGHQLLLELRESPGGPPRDDARGADPRPTGQEDVP